MISGGENIYPAEIEQTLIGLDGVLEVAVVSSFDSTLVCYLTTSVQ